MPDNFTIELSPEKLQDGSAEERATFGIFSIRAGDAFLTEGFDYFLKGYRKGPLIPGYHAAQWLAWNWWRLRWEPRSSSGSWDFAHCMPSIGEGYAWPNLRIFPDGVRTAFISQPSARADAKPFRYVGSAPLILPATLFERAIDEFVQQMISQLRAHAIVESNLETVWSDVLAERADPALSRFRKVEALLGYDADEIAEDRISALIAEYAHLGPTALEEVAADSAQTGQDKFDLPPVEEFENAAKEKGYDASVRDMAHLRGEHRLIKGADVAGWKVGAAAARLVREQEDLGAAPLSNQRLAQLSGTEQRALSDVGMSGFNMGFTLDQPKKESRVVLRSKWETGRRFELARLLGDRLINPAGALHPATRSHTYRQKAQRSFAAELLAPFDAVDEMLKGDLSSESQEEVAAHFDVSPMTIHTLLMNHGRIPREEADPDFDLAAA